MDTHEKFPLVNHPLQPLSIFIKQFIYQDIDHHV